MTWRGISSRLLLRLRLGVRSGHRRLVQHHRVAPDIVQAQITQVARQIEQVAPINCAAAIVVAWLFGAGNPALLASAAALFVSTIAGLFTLPAMRWTRIRYRRTLHQWRAMHIYALVTGLVWSAIMGVPLVTVDPEARTYLFCTMVASMCVGGLVLAMLPLAATIYTVALGLTLAAAFWVQPIAIPAAMYFADFLLMAMLSRVFFDLSNLFINQLQVAKDLAAAEQAKRDADRAEIERRAAEQMAIEQEREAARNQEQGRHREELLRLAERFEAEVLGVAGQLGDAVGRLQGSSTALREIGRETSGKAEAVSGRATGASRAVGGVAAASAQMIEAVDHVAARVSEQVEASAEARLLAEETRRALEELAASAQDIASVATFIQDIASSTNLLALNATIEAARAGEAGRGFAVVAHEVKSLANQTGAAIGRIGATTEAIQERVAGALAAVDKAAAQVDAVSQRAEAIAEAVTQQRQASDHIGRNAGDAAADAEDVHANIASLAERVRETDSLTDSMRELAGTLDAQSRALAAASRDFLGRLRAA
jgi:methyl-accepting chemotaxis protein